MAPVSEILETSRQYLATKAGNHFEADSLPFQRHGAQHLFAALSDTTFNPGTQLGAGREL